MTQHFPAPQEPQPGWIGPYRLANLGWRIAAFLIDVVPPLIVWILIFSLDRHTRTTTAACNDLGPNGICVHTKTTSGLAWLADLVALAWTLANNVYLQGRSGQSIGKRALGMQLARPMYLEGRGNTFVLPGIGLCLLRQILHVLDGLPLAAGYWLAPLVSKRRQTFADMIVGTVVLAPRANNGSLYPLERGQGVRA